MVIGTLSMPKSNKPKRQDVSTKIDPASLRLAHVAAAAAGMTTVEWISDRVAALAKQEVDAIDSSSIAAGQPKAKK